MIFRQLLVVQGHDEARSKDPAEIEEYSMTRILSVPSTHGCDSKKHRSHPYPHLAKSPRDVL